MATLQRVRLISNERLDLPDLLNIENFACADFDQYFEKFMSDTPFIIQGFDIVNPAGKINSTSTDIEINIANSAMFSPTSSNTVGGFYVAPASEAVQVLTLTPNATNYIEMSQTTTTGAPDTRSFWDPSANGGQGGEFNQIIDTVTFLKVETSVNTIGFTAGRIPIAKVVVNNAGPPVITSITDSRPMFFRLGSGGNIPDPLFNHNWPDSPTGYSRTDVPVTITSGSDPNPFLGSDKNIRHFKDWMNAVMTRLKEMAGSSYWFANTGLISGASLSNLWWDSVGSRLTGTGAFSHSGGASTGFLDFGTINILDGETFTLNDGQNPAIIFEFDNNASVAGANVPVTIGAGAITILNTIQEFRDATISAINGVGATLLITASIGGDGRVSLRNDEAGPQGNVAISETVVDAGFVVSGMVSGANVGTLSWTSDIFVRSILGNYYFMIPAGSVSLEDDEVAYLTQIRNQPIPSVAMLNWTGLASPKLPPPSVQTYGTGGNTINYVDGSAGSFTGLVIGDFIKKESDGYNRYVKIKNFRAAAGGTGGTVAANVALSAELEIQMEVTGATGTWLVGDTVTGPGPGTAVIGSILKNRTLDSNDMRIVVTGITGTFTTGAAVTVPAGAGTFQQLIGGYEGTTASEKAQYAKSTYSLTVTKRDDVPNNADVWWLGFRDDNGSTTAKIFLGKSGAELDEGESVGISSTVPAGLLAYVGSPDENDSTPDYGTDATGSITGSRNYNTANGENLTQRVSKLTSMVADKAQDKNIEMLLDGVLWTWNLATETLSWSSTITFQIPSSTNNNTLAAGSVVLAAGRVSYVTLDRNAVSALSASVVLSDAVPLAENVFVFARRDGTAVLIGSSFRLEATDAAVGEYTDHLRNDKIFKPIITQAAPNTAFSIYPSQRLSGGKRKYFFVSPTGVSKFPRNGSAQYDGGVNNDNLTVISFDALTTPGTILARVTFPSIAIATFGSVATPVGLFIAALIQVNVDDSISVNWGSPQASLALAMADDNLPSAGNSAYPVAIAILEATGATTLAAITESRFIDIRPAGFGVPAADFGADYDKHQDALSENDFEEIFIDIINDADNINASQTTLTVNTSTKRATATANAELVDYDPAIAAVTPDSDATPWTLDGDGTMDSIVGTELRVNDANAAAHLFYKRTEVLAVGKAHQEIEMPFRITSATADGSLNTGVFAELNDDVKRIRVGIYLSAGIYSIGFSNATDTGLLAGTTSFTFDASVTHTIRLVKIGNYAVQLYYDGTLKRTYPYSTFGATANAGRIAWGTFSDTALVDATFNTVKYAVYGQILESTDFVRKPNIYLDGTVLPESATPAWTKTGTQSSSIITFPGYIYINDASAVDRVEYTLSGVNAELNIDGRRKNAVFEAGVQIVSRTASAGALNEVAYMRLRDGSRSVIVAITDDGATQGLAIAASESFAAVLAGTVVTTGINFSSRPRYVRIEKESDQEVRVYLDRELLYTIDWATLPLASSNADVTFGTSSATNQAAICELKWDNIYYSSPDELSAVGLPVTDFLATVTTDDIVPIIWFSSDGGITWCEGANGETAGLDLDNGAVAGANGLVRIGLSTSGAILEDYSVMYNQTRFTTPGIFKYYEYTAVGGETLIVLPFAYVQGNNELEVIENGVELYVGSSRDFIESSPSAVTLNTAADVGDRYKFRVNRRIVGDNLTPTPAGSGRREIWQITGGSNPPSSGAVSGSLGWAQALKFNPGVDEDIFLQVPIPDNCDITLPIGIVLKYVMSTSNAGDVKLNFNYVVATSGDDVDPGVADATLSSTFAPGLGLETKKQNSTFQVSASFVASTDDMIIAQLQREGTNVADTHTGELELMSVEINYTTL